MSPLAPSDKLYTGQQQESGDALGLYHYGARFYSTHLGRFLSVDPVVPAGHDPQAWNPYTYVRNNPLRFIDPTGMRWVDDGGGRKKCDTACQWKAAKAAFYRAAAHQELVGALLYLAATRSLEGAQRAAFRGHTLPGFKTELQEALEAIHAHCMSDRPSPMCLGVTHDVATGCLKGDQRCIDAERFPGTQCVRWDPVCRERAEKSGSCALPASHCPLTKFAKSQPCKWVFGCDPTRMSNPFKEVWKFVSTRSPQCWASLGVAAVVTVAIVGGSAGGGAAGTAVVLYVRTVAAGDLVVISYSEVASNCSS